MTPANSLSSTVLPLAEVQPGARLTAAVFTADGQVLMTAGEIVTETALAKLARLGIARLAIEMQRNEAELNAAREALRRRIEHLFRRCDLEGDSSGARTLYKAVLDYRLALR
ncbi:MAG: hypothetical protein U1A72_24800 [Sulfuritalea sp.]|nr:hypothetical protein [Sulfuritalea sp.]MDZ4255798.1 hypothetical protein [Sulfuritalea sp.]